MDAGHPEQPYSTWLFALAFCCAVAIEQTIGFSLLVAKLKKKWKEIRMARAVAMAMESDLEWEKAEREAELLNATKEYDGDAPWVTLGNSMLVVLESEPQVEVHVIRLGAIETSLTVDLETRDLTAKLGREYLGLVGPGAPQQPPSKTVSITFDAGNRLCTATIPLRPSSGYSSVKSLSVLLKPPPGVLSGRRDCRVRIYNVDPFPHGRLYSDEKLLGLGATTFNARLDTYRARISIVYRFLISAHRGALVTSAWHQVGRIFDAAFYGFVAPILYDMMIKKGTVEFMRLDYSCYTGLMMMGLYLLSMIVSQWFHAGWDVQKRMQRNLTRKFLSLSDRDHAALDPTNRDAYRVAISKTCSKLTGQAYGGFHSFLANVWNLVFAISYAFYSATDMSQTVRTGYIVAIAAAIFLLPTVQFFRANKSWLLWKDKYSADIKLQSNLANLLNQWSLIRANKREGRETIKLEASISDFLNAGYNLWYYNLKTSWWCLGSLQLLIYVMWAGSPILTNKVDQLLTPSEFLVVLYLLAFIGGSANGLQTALIGLYTSGSMVQEIAKLLNFPTTEEMLLSPDAGVIDCPLPDGNFGSAPVADGAKAAVADGAKAAVADGAKAAVADGAKSTARATSKTRSASVAPEPASVETMAKALESMILTELSGGDGKKSQLHRSRSESQLAELSALGPRQKLLLEESRSMIAGHLSQSSGHHYAIRIDEACFHQRGQASVFKNLRVYNREGRVIDMIPAGGMIGVRTSATGIFSELCEKVLMKLLCGDFKTQSGTAVSLCEAQLVVSHPVVLMGTLMQNILYGVVPDQAFNEDGILCNPMPSHIEGLLPTSEENMWRLCRCAGVSRVLIGDTFVPGKWASQQLAKVVAWLPLADIVQIGLVRALLHQPSVLMMLRVGSDWALADQAQLSNLLEAYLTCNGDIGKMLAEVEAGNPNKLKAPTSKNAVIVCAADPLLASRLDEHRDSVLTIESPSKATFLTVEDGGLDAQKVQRTKELQRSGILRSSWSREEATTTNRDVDVEDVSEY